MNTSIVINELKFKAIRSSGAGGQHVNKVSSKIELALDIMTSTGFTDDEKLRLSQKLSSRLTKSGVLLLQCGDSRSQHRNKELVIKRLLEILKANLYIPKKRKQTKPSRAAIKKRLDSKQKHALKKANRKKPSL
ncbi:ribosome-associated protein [Aquimarina sp. EL_43]|uniref:alternative ribosome rescue aminoacyl-tRNA hydrolase ArfB n=1 Tax=unclassified Aquimarina TaxID=2627091 RepID=UPI0018CA5D36|nr:MULTISPECIES: alternative ribosome rescue aminoacyl-tRNA hydrolase ArfB [unclassified Aquimarina]MBG6131959.1 ribosome-associated protein [Aquimarina sp. EL_35]MBG6149523.1 ribosome-associated protein [Aquimarina sp. EL_32]MBG6170214.1 ribosome-associated protein [Aquimarina sp. EL_43]